MTGTEHLIRRIAACGYDVKLADGLPTLVPNRPDPYMTDALLATLKLNRADVIAFVTANPTEPESIECQLCHAIWFCPETEILEACVGPHFCYRGGSWKHKVEKCPYKRDEQP